MAKLIKAKKAEYIRLPFGLSQKLMDELDNYGYGDTFNSSWINPHFNPKHPYFAVSVWDSGQILDSIEDIKDLEGLFFDAATRTNDAFQVAGVWAASGDELEAKISVNIKRKHGT